MILLSKCLFTVISCATLLAQDFESKVNVVLVPVVVRDARGSPVGSLSKKDFRLFDKGKLQNITSFLAVRRGTVPDAPGGQSQKASATEAVPVGHDATAQRYFIYLFDDLNTRFADMAQLREAAVRHFQRALPQGDQAAIYSFSGRLASNFTNDREQLAQTVAKLRWRPEIGHGGMQCPDVSYYVADLVLAKGDAQAFAALTNHTMACSHLPLKPAQLLAQAASVRELKVGAQDTQVALGTLRRAIRRLSSMSGQRVIIMASPGFFAQTPEAARSMAEVVDLAAKSNVIVNGLSPRGVIVAEENENIAETKGAVLRPPSQNSPAEKWKSLRVESAHAGGDVMEDLAAGTGGRFFGNNNNLDLGLEQTANAAEFSYLLGFSPALLKADGSFHPLKVSLQNQHGYKVEARRGYYAFENNSSDSRTAEEIDDAVFARNTANDIPIVLQTGYSKRNDSDDATVRVVAKVDLSALHYQKTGPVNGDSFRAAAVLFDSDGGYVTGSEQTVNLHLRDQTLKAADPGVTLRWELNAKAGSYLIRLVIREADGKAMTTVNRPVTVP